MPRGQPFQPGNHFGRGRPKGSRNKRTLQAQELLDSHSEAIVRQALVLALKGDRQMIGLLLGYVLPRRRDLPLNTGPLPMGTTAELYQSSEKLMQKVTSGQITPNEASILWNMMDDRRSMIVTEDFEKRLCALEPKVKKP
jgi:hypothetical protein